MMEMTAESVLETHEIDKNIERNKNKSPTGFSEKFRC